MLKADNLASGYGEKEVLRELGLRVEKGERMTIIGANGSGKSTLLKTLSRNLRPRKGVVYLDGISILEQDTRTVARRLAMLPQGPRAPEDFTVRDLVSCGRHPYLGWNGRLKSRDLKIVDWAMAAARVEDLQHRAVSTLSGGERQRAWLALALAQQPEVLLLDEPTTHLDIGCQIEVLELVKSLNEKLGITVIMVLHDLNLAARYSKTIAVLKGGRVFKTGTPEEIITESVLEGVFNLKVKVFTDHDNHCPYYIPLGAAFGEVRTWSGEYAASSE